MDVTQETVSRLYAQGHSIKSAARRAGCSPAKAKKILITLGQYSSVTIAEAQRLRSAGASVAEIAATLEVTPKAVHGMLPYSKGMYAAEYPSLNALRIRQSRAKQRDK